MAIGEYGHVSDAGNSHEATDHFIGLRDILKLPVGQFRKYMLASRQKSTTTTAMKPSAMPFPRLLRHLDRGQRAGVL